jgi:hypothetical protein
MFFEKPLHIRPLAELLEGLNINNPLSCFCLITKEEIGEQI